MSEAVIDYICDVAAIPSFSSYEERLHPYIEAFFSSKKGFSQISMPANNRAFYYDSDSSNRKTIALAAHLDKINHFSADFDEHLSVSRTNDSIQGLLDDATGIGIILRIADLLGQFSSPNVLFLFSEMEESKGLKEHPERLKNAGKEYSSGMGAKAISHSLIEQQFIPDEIITIDTTPLFKGKKGVALYDKHWELNELDASSKLKSKTQQLVDNLLSIDTKIHLSNNTNDYLHYGKIFNEQTSKAIPSIALEPAIFPYHQPNEKVFIYDILRVKQILQTHLKKAQIDDE